MIDSYSDLEGAHRDLQKSAGIDDPSIGAHIDSNNHKRFPVMEIFGPTLQGEGSVIGMQTMFIRFGGCDYRCKMCDSLHAVLPSEVKKHARWLTTEEIITELNNIAGHCRMVTFSGGNPLMWNLTDLALALQCDRWEIAVETQGTIFRSWIVHCDYITVSPKGPGMGEKFELDKFNYFIQQCVSPYEPGVSIKVVIFGQEDIEFAKNIVSLWPFVPIYLSLGNPWPPVLQGGEMEPYYNPAEMSNKLLARMQVLWEDIKNEPLLTKARFLPQMHVLLWANKQGV